MQIPSLIQHAQLTELDRYCILLKTQQNLASKISGLYRMKTDSQY